MIDLLKALNTFTKGEREMKKRQEKAINRVFRKSATRYGKGLQRVLRTGDGYAYITDGYLSYRLNMNGDFTKDDATDYPIDVLEKHFNNTEKKNCVHYPVCKDDLKKHEMSEAYGKQLVKIGSCWYDLKIIKNTWDMLGKHVFAEEIAESDVYTPLYLKGREGSALIMPCRSI